MVSWVVVGILVLGSAARADQPTAEELPRRGFLGTMLGPVTDEIRQEQGLKPEQGGAVVREVIPGSTAAAAELQAGDVVIAFGDTPIDGPPALVRAMSQVRAGSTETLRLVRGGETVTRTVTVRERPRESSDEFDVIYGSVTSRGNRLRTILTRPRGEGPFPALFLIQGVGMASVDNAVGPMSSHRAISSEFTRKGFVTLRVEKPGVGDSEGGPAGVVDFDAELDGYRQALAALRAMPFVDSEKVLLFGHSMGGVMAPLLAEDVPVRGIAVYGTLAVTWHEYMLENVRRQLELGGEDPEGIDEAMRQEEAILHGLFVENHTPAELSERQPELQPRLAALCPDGREYVGRSVDFFRQLAEQNLGAAWSRYGGRALALWGEADYISARADHERIARFVNRSHPGAAEFRALPGIDHGLNRADTPEESAGNAHEPEDFNDMIIGVLLGWAAEVVGPAGDS